MRYVIPLVIALMQNNIYITIGAFIVAWLYKREYFDQNQIKTFLIAGSKMSPGDYIAATSGQYILLFQSDGNLVLYDKQNTVKWQSNTVGLGQGGTFIFGTNGQIGIQDMKGNMIWKIPSSPDTTGTVLQISNRGVLFLTATDGQTIWSSG